MKYVGLYTKCSIDGLDEFVVEIDFYENDQLMAAITHIYEDIHTALAVFREAAEDADASYMFGCKIAKLPDTRDHWLK